MLLTLFLRRSALLLTASLAGHSFLQAAGQISIVPGKLATVANGSNNILAGNPDAGNAATAPSFNGLAFWNSPTEGPVVYMSDGLKHVVFKLVQNTGQVTTYAGTGAGAYNGGQSGPATTVPMEQPAGIGVDSSGNVYVADATRNVVWSIDYASKNMRLFAGNGVSGTPGYSGDGGQATGAQLAVPTGLAVDQQSGSVYIADSFHNQVEVVATSGVITRIAGTGTGGYDASGLGTNVHLNLPTGVAIDSTNQLLYIADSQNHVVRQLTLANLNLVTFAGRYQTVIDPGTSTPRAVGGFSASEEGGAATSAQLNSPFAVAVDGAGSLYIGDTRNNLIRKVDATGTIRAIAGLIQSGTPVSGYSGDGGPSLSGAMNSPSQVALDLSTSNVYFVDSGNEAVRSILASAATVTFPLTAAGSTATQTITIANTGNQSVSISGFQFSATNFATTSGGSCSSAPSLAPGNSCTLAVQFTAVAGGATTGTMTISILASGNTPATTISVPLAESTGLRYVPITPCRVVDTRVADQTFGGGPLAAGAIRSFPIRNSVLAGNGACTAPGPVPTSATVQAYAVNVTVVPTAGSLKYLTIYPTGLATPPFVSTVNSYDGRVKANAAIVPAGSDSSQSVSVYVSDGTQVIIDINGYFVPQADASGISYYPLPPCRVVDTRSANASLGGPTLVGGATRSFPLPSSTSCSVPANAKAYSLNVTTVPRTASLNYLTLWPSDQNQPFVSTLNSPTGAVVANAAIVSANASDGSIKAYATDAADMILDINGYFAAPGNGGLALYPVTPCRAFDTTDPTLNANVTNAQGVTTQNIIPDANIGCATDANAKAALRTAQNFVLNATIVPTSPVIYLADWAHGTAQPLQSTLNSYDTSINSNLAIVPTLDGSVSSFTSTTGGVRLVLDVFGYFAP